MQQVKVMGIKQVLSAPRSPWQRAYVKRLIGSIRRECLDHVSVFGERSLQRALKAYTSYNHDWRTHLSLGKDAPRGRPVQSPEEGDMVEIPEVGGFHHHYERKAIKRVMLRAAGSNILYAQSRFERPDRLCAREIHEIPVRHFTSKNIGTKFT